jgi:mannosyltransferase
MSEEIDLEDVAPWVVLILTLIGAGLRVLLLASKGMSADETVSVWLASHNLSEMMQWILKIGQQPPLYYFLLHYWIALKGNTTYSVRLLSVLFGAGTIPIIYLIGKRMAGAAVGLAAAVILAASPFHIYFAQETSMYTLLTFNAAIAIYALVRLVTDPRSSRPIGSQFRESLRALRTPAPVEPRGQGAFSYKDESREQARWRARIFHQRRLPIQSIETDLAWIVFIVFSAITLLSHSTAILFFFTTNLIVFGLMLLQKIRKAGAQPTLQAPSLMNWVIAQIVILILWIPWVIPYFKQANAIWQNLLTPAPTWSTVLQTLGSFLSTSASIPAVTTGMWILYALVFCLGLVLYRSKISQFLFLIALIAIPFLIELVVSLWHPFFLDQTLIWTTIPLFLMLALGVTQLKFRSLIFTVLGIICTINMFSASDYFRFFQKEDWNTAARDVAGLAEKDDLVLFNSNIGEIPFDYYFTPYADYYSLQVEEHGIPLDVYASGIAEAKMTASDLPGLAALLSGHHRAWLIDYNDSNTDPTGLIPQTLAAKMKLIEEDDFYGGKVQLYGAP